MGKRAHARSLLIFNILMIDDDGDDNDDDDGDDDDNGEDAGDTVEICSLRV